jgi:hypothetical protein
MFENDVMRDYTSPNPARFEPRRLPSAYYPMELFHIFDGLYASLLRKINNAL